MPVQDFKPGKARVQAGAQRVVGRERHEIADRTAPAPRHADGAAVGELRDAAPHAPSLGAAEQHRYFHHAVGRHLHIQMSIHALEVPNVQRQVAVLQKGHLQGGPAFIEVDRFRVAAIEAGRNDVAGVFKTVIRRCAANTTARICD